MNLKLTLKSLGFIYPSKNLKVKSIIIQQISPYILATYAWIIGLLFVGIWIYLINYFSISLFNPPILEEAIPKFPSNSFIVFCLIAMFIAPICEEILFRGFLLKKISSKYGPRKSILITSIGFITSFFFILIFSLILIAIISPKEKNELKNNSILHLKFDQTITDQNKEEDFSFNLNGLNAKDNSLENILQAIENAKTDEKIVGIFLEPSIVNTGIATTNEIRNKLQEFKNETKKFIISYSEIYSQKAYYISSSQKVYKAAAVGTITYTTGKIVLTKENIASVENYDGSTQTYVRLTVIPNSNDIVPVRNQVLEIDTTNMTVTGVADSIASGSSDGGTQYSTSSSYST